MAAIRHGGRVRVLALDPMPRAPGTIRRVASLGHDAFQAKLAGMLEDKQAIFLNQVLVEPQVL
jgi:hypothetical protein